MWVLNNIAELKNSEETAIIHREEKISFCKLWRRSESITGFLMENREKFGIDQKTPIVIYGNKESDIVACMHAALKTGVAYAPVDTLYPEERLDLIMHQVGAKVLFNFSGKDIKTDITVINQESLVKIYKEYSTYQSSSKNWVQPDDDCYILFTSGSTGLPKGVPIKRRNLESFIDWIQPVVLPEDSQSLVVMNQPPYSFDLSVFAIYAYLAAGCTLYSFDKDMLSNMKDLYKYFSESHLNAWVSTPSFIDFCCHEGSFNETMLPELQTFVVDGEILTKKTVREIRRRFPKARFINAYGPTECTVAVSACEITDDMLNAEDSLPVGKLMENAYFKLLNPEVQDGKSIGELAISGPSVGSGYYKNVEKTKASFWYDEEKGLYGYRTGDLVYVKDGLLYYVDRMDNQIKLNGYRIELGDISENVNKLPYISKNVVIPIKDADGKISYLMDVYALREQSSESNLKLTIRIKKDLARLVPAYMVPKKFKRVDVFPLNVNGKIDRKKLLEEIQ